jgi:excisionase family DNA binding protein
MTPKSVDEDLLDIKQAAQFLQVSETSLRRWTNAGRLASLRVGRRRERRFRRADLVAFMEHHPAAVEIQKTGRTEAAARMTVAGVAVPVGTHVCGLYESEEGRTAQAAAFFSGGLQPGMVCVLVAAPRVRDLILARLENDSGSPVQADVDASRLFLSEYADTCEAQWEYFESILLAATQRGVRSIRVIGDVSGGSLADNMEEVTRYETGYDRLIARRFPTLTLCQYDVRQYSGRDVFGIYKCHGDNFTLPAERLLA